MTTANMKPGIPTQINRKTSYQGLPNLLTGLAAAILFAWMALAGPLARAQSTGRGNITGIVTDPTGAVIVDAHVTITNIATNVALESVTNGTGYFEIDSLDAATYKISVNATGFKQLIQSGVVLQASGVIRL